MSATFKLDGRDIPFEPGQTVMDAALDAGVYIPHLCHHPEFQVHGSCKLCTVAVGSRNAAACTTAASEGLEVRSETRELNALRRRLTQMLFVEGNHFCPACEKSGDCRLQAVAYHLGMDAPHLPHFYPDRPVDASHPEVLLDLNRCINCELCVRASRDVDGKNVFALSGRGIRTHLVVNSESGRLGDSALAAGDRALSVCPVGAILPKGRGFAVPIGSRTYDLLPIAQDALEREGHHG